MRSESYAGAADINLQCQRVLDLKHAVLCQHLLRKGNTPAPYRGALWSYVLGSHVNAYVWFLIFHFIFAKIKLKSLTGL